MPIYEFKCLKCGEMNELLLLSSNEEVEPKCSKCSSPELERVISSTNFCMGNGSGGNQSAKAQTRQCSGGSCTTYDIPGHTK